MDDEEWVFQYLEEDLTEDFTEAVALPENTHLKEDALQSSVLRVESCLHATHDRGVFA